MALLSLLFWACFGWREAGAVIGDPVWLVPFSSEASCILEAAGSRELPSAGRDFTFLLHSKSL